MYKFCVNVIKVIFFLCGGVKVYNKENFLFDKGFVIVCMYVGWVDVFMFGVGILFYQIYYMVKKELFQKKWIGGFLKKIYVFLVDCENLGLSSIKMLIKFLKEGQIVGIFLSGMRILEDVLLKRGVVIIV